MTIQVDPLPDSGTESGADFRSGVRGAGIYLECDYLSGGGSPA